MRLLVAGLRKLIRRPATWVTLGLLVALLGLVFVAVGATARQATTEQGGRAALLLVTFPGAYTLIVSFILGLGGLLVLIYGAAVAGSEWTWGTLKAAVARGEARSRYMILTYGSIALLAGAGLLVAFPAGILAAFVGANLAAVGTSGIADTATLQTLPEQLLRGWLALAEDAALGFAVATIARSQLAGVGLGIGLYFGEQFASIFIPDIVKYLPFNAASAVVAVSGGLSSTGQAPSALDPNTALVVVVAWLVAALVVAALVSERAEIGG